MKDKVDFATLRGKAKSKVSYWMEKDRLNQCVIAERDATIKQLRERIDDLEATIVDEF